MAENFITLKTTTCALDDLPQFFAPELPEKPTADDWKKLPAITSFRERQSDKAALTVNIEARFALVKGRLFLHFICRTGAKEKLPMRSSYVDWSFDNAIEFFIGSGTKVSQFELNAAGAAIQLKFGDAEDISDYTLTGINEPGGWELEFSAPAEELIPGGRGGFKLVCFDLNTVLGTQYYDSVNTAVYAFGTLNCGPGKNDPYFSGEGLMPPDRDMLYSLTESFFRRKNMPLPDISSINSIRGAAHDIFNLALPERKDISEIDLNTEISAVRPINGVNFGPNITNQANRDMNPLYRELGTSSMRTHDVALTEAGSRLVDTIFVFPLEHADPSNPENYFFDQTDYYFENTMAQGPDIYYRLGVSIDHAKKRFTAIMPKNFDHYAEICAGIVRHYNRGWANGHHWNIRYWEIWNEPESDRMWSGTFDDYLNFFVTVYKRLKSEFPEIKVGAFGAMHLNVALFKQLADKCRANGITPDFISWHHYSSNIIGMSFQPYAARSIADALGFENAELHLTEWHYVNLPPGSAAGTADMGGTDSAAFTCGVLTAWQDSPMDLSHYYTAGRGASAWGIFDEFCKPKSTYYALCACGKFHTRYRRRLSAVNGADGTYTLAAADDKGNILVMFTCFKIEADTVSIKFKGLSDDAEIKVEVLDSEHTLTEVPFTRKGNILELSKTSPSAVFLVYINK